MVMACCTHPGFLPAGLVVALLPVVARAEARLTPPPPPTAVEERSLVEGLERERKELFKNAADGVVFIRCGDGRFGSGFFVHSAGLIATSGHVVACGEYKPAVILRTGEKRVARIVAHDPIHDLALLQVALGNTNVTVLSLADSEAVQVGDYAAAISHPVGAVWTLNEGLVSNRHPGEHDEYAGVLQLQVPLQRGSSGGPVLDKRGQVMGVVTSKHRTADNTAFCVQSNLVKRLLLEHVLATHSQLGVHGTVVGAEVFVDGDFVGIVPTLITLPHGSHELVVKRDGRSLTRTLVLSQGSVFQVFVKAEDLQ